jgi:putative protein kinase ArgK-like GTPase of G3E family
MAKQTARFRLLVVTGNPGAGRSTLVDRWQGEFSPEWAFVR